MKKKRESTPKTPAKQGKRGGNPPEEYRFKPGESGNPAGRPNAGATIREWINQLAASGLTEKQIRTISRDADEPWPKRTAANRILCSLERGDLADMEPWLRGEKSLEDLRAGGLDTAVVKKAKVKRIQTEGGEIEERECELHDRGGGDFDRVTETTDGKPRQPVDLVVPEPIAFEVLGAIPPKD